MKRYLLLIIMLILALSLCACGAAVEEEAAEPAPEETAEPAPEETVEEAAWPDLSGQSLLVYCGAGMKDPFQEISDRFTELTGCEMNVTFANAAQIQLHFILFQDSCFSLFVENELFTSGMGQSFFDFLRRGQSAGFAALPPKMSKGTHCRIKSTVACFVELF